MADGVRSAGSLVGAVLESVGYHYQSHILNELTDPFTNQLGGLIYLVGLILAIGSIAMQGQYRLGVWLLIGPPLFFAVIVPRDPIPNARWQFAFRERDTAEVNDRVKEVLQTAQNAAGGGQARVSRLFARYVELVSLTTNEIVRIISNERRDEDLWFIVRAELFGLMHTARIEETGLVDLMHKALFHDCQEVLEAAREAQDPLFRERQNSNPGRDEIDKTPTVEKTKEYFEQRKAEASERYKRLLEIKDKNYTEETATYLAMREGAADVNARAQEIKQMKVSCADIWNEVLKAITAQAEREGNELLRRAAAMLIKPEAVVNTMEQGHGIPRNQPLTHDVNDFSNSANTDKITKIIAKFMFRNEARDPSKASRLQHFVTRLETRNIEGSFEGRNSETEKVRIGAQEWSEKERLIHAAGSLPYYQGIGLFLLGATFPFFALLLLVPGKHGGFLLWFILWIWLKSWDVALAGIMLVDDVLFSMLAVQKQTIGQRDGTDVEKQLDIMFAAMAEMDPTFQLSTYYTIIATAILAVPPTTGQLILGSLRSGATLVSAGVEKTAEFFAQNTLVGTQQIALDALKSQALELKEQRLQSYLANANQGRLPHAGMRQPDGSLEDPTNLNPVRGYRRLAGSGGNADGRPGHGNWNEAAAARYSALADRAGVAAGRSDPGRPAGSRPHGLTGAAMQMFNARDKNIAGTQWQQAFKVLEADRQALAAHAEWDGDIDQRAVRVHEQIALWGGIPIPWSNFTAESSGGELNLALARYIFQQEMIRAEWATRREQIAALTTITTQVLNTTLQEGMRQQPQKYSLDQMLANATPEERAEIRSRYGDYLTRYNDLHKALNGYGSTVLGTGATGLLTADHMNIWEQSWKDWGLQMYGAPKGGYTGLFAEGELDPMQRIETIRTGGVDPATQQQVGGLPK